MRILLLFLLTPVYLLAQIQQESSIETAMPTNYVGSSNVKYAPFSYMEGVASYSLTRTSSPVRSGKYSWRVELRQTDAAVPVFSSYRAEIEMTDNNTAVSYQANSHAWSNYFPSAGGGWRALTQEKCFAQWHPFSPTYSGGSPSLAFEIKAGNIRRVIRHTSGNTTPGATEVMLTKDYGPVPLDTWIDWEVYYSPKVDGTGLVIVDWIVNGVRTRKDSVVGPNLHAWSRYPFWKLGIYDWNIKKSPISSDPRILYIDMIRFGKATPSTFRSVIGIQDNQPPAPNQPPTCFAGNSQALAAGITTAALLGDDGDADGSVVSRLWSKVSGPGTQSIANSTQKSATVSGLQTGSYVFQYAVTDDDGATAVSTVGITVAAANQAPVCYAGNAQNLPYPQSNTVLSGTDSDPDGSVTGRTWVKVSGPGSQVFGSPTSASTTVSGLQPGSYVFRYQVVDNSGATATSTVGVTVAAAPNRPPVVSVDTPFVVINTTTSKVITANATDPDGTIVSRLWTQQSGPNTATITPNNTATTTVSGLVPGSYVFRHEVTDDKGAAGASTVTVLVNIPPVVVIGPGLDTAFIQGVINIPCSGSATDADGTIVSYKWSVLSGAGTFADETQATTVFTATGGGGEYSLQLMATDNNGGTSSDTYSFSIKTGWLIQRHGWRNTIPTH